MALASISPLGSIRTQQQIYILESKGAEPTAAYFKPVVVAWRNGAPVRLQDIAKVEDSVENEEARAGASGACALNVLGDFNGICGMGHDGSRWLKDEGNLCLLPQCKDATVARQYRRLELIIQNGEQ